MGARRRRECWQVCSRCLRCIHCIYTFTFWKRLHHNPDMSYLFVPCCDTCIELKLPFVQGKDTFSCLSCIQLWSGNWFLRSTSMVISLFSTEGALRIPTTYDNHSIQPKPIYPQSLFYHLNRPRIDLSRPTIMKYALRWSDYILTTFWEHSEYILATFWLHSDYILTTFWSSRTFDLLF